MRGVPARRKGKLGMLGNMGTRIQERTGGDVRMVRGKNYKGRVGGCTGGGMRCESPGEMGSRGRAEGKG